MFLKTMNSFSKNWPHFSLLASLQKNLQPLFCKIVEILLSRPPLPPHSPSKREVETMQYHFLLLNFKFESCLVIKHRHKICRKIRNGLDSWFFPSWFVLFYLLFGYPTATFGSLLKGQPHSPNVYHFQMSFMASITF